MDGYVDRRHLAGLERSATAALWHSGSKNLAWADWPLSGNRYGSFGHAALIGGCWKRPFEPTSESTTIDLTIAAVGGAAPH